MCRGIPGSGGRQHGFALCAMRFGDIQATLHVQMCCCAPSAGGDAEAELWVTLLELAWQSPDCVI